MRNIITIARREFPSYFTSPLAYFVIPVFLGLVGFFSQYFDDFFAAEVASLKSVFTWCVFFQFLLIPH